MSKNAAGERLEVDMIVDRLDNYKRGGRVYAIRPHADTLPVLVRWPGLDYEWCAPDLLMPRP